jgi:hypothetical protein
MGMSKLKDLFENLINEDFTTTKIYDRLVTVREFPTVHRDDWIPVTMIEPDYKLGPWIAGGAALRWFQNLPVGENDIDVFCSNARQAEDVIQRIKSYGRFTVKYESDNAVTLEAWEQSEYENRWTIQIIKRRYFNSLKDVIGSFDITVCEIGTSGNEWELGDFTAKDIKGKHLRFKLPLQPDSVKRLTKYWIYGYEPVEGTLDLITASPQTKWQYAVDEDYQNAF